MKQNYIGVPFKAESGLSETNGIAKFSPAGVVMEFESKLLGLVGGKVKEVRVSLDEILDIKFRKGFLKFFPKIELRLRSVSKLGELPNEGGKVKLRIKREDFELAKKAVADTLQYMSGFDPKALETKDKGQEELPPPQTSVNEIFDTRKLEKEKPFDTNKLKKDS